MSDNATSYGFQVFSDEGVTLTHEGGVACFIDESTQDVIQLNGIPQNWVWFAPCAVVDLSVPIYAFNAPSFFCYITDTTIVNNAHDADNVSVMWGIA